MQEWQRQMHINFIDYEKACDNIYRDNLLGDYMAFFKSVLTWLKPSSSISTGQVGSSDVYFENAFNSIACEM